MGKLNKNELLEGVRSIINESFNNDVDSFDGTSKFNIHRYVNNLIEEGHKNPDLMSYLLKYDNILQKGTKDFMIFELFGQGLVKYAKGNAYIKEVINEMNSILESDGRNLAAYKLIENISDEIIKDDILESFNQYVYNKNEETRDSLLEALQPMLILSDPIALQLNLMLTEDAKLTAKKIDLNYFDDSDAKALQEKLQELRNKKTMEKLVDKVKDYIDNKFAEEERQLLLEQDLYSLNTIANNQGLNILEHINNIRHTDACSNERLMEMLNVYSDALTHGAYEERLYENFLYNVSKFNHLLPVKKAINAINETANNKHEEITLTKLLEEMKDTYTSAIYVDLIEEDLVRYVKEPSPTNRILLRNALMPYASDPFINEMFNVLYADNTPRANELTEKVLNIKDQINIIRENATVTNIYTPVQYVCENECIFNVNGQFYVKKGNNIAVLEEKYVNLLNESFIELCRLVNDPHVSILDNYIILNGNEQTAHVYEGYVEIHGHKESKESLRNLNEMCMKYDNYDTNFYIMCSCLLENFNNIAKVDWAKHVSLNENNNISADLFKLDQNIFMVTHNDSTALHTFYRNVNPIFCKNKLNEHMGINVSSLFSDLLPSQDKIILKLNETKNSYEDSIEKYEDMIDKLKEALKDASEENKEKLEKAVEDAEEKLEDIKKEYVEWQKLVDDVTGNSDEDESDDKEDENEDSEDNVVKEEPNEPLSDDEVDPAKYDLMQPITSGDSNVENLDNFETEENDEGISDDEFANFLGSDSEEDEENFDENDEEDFVNDSDDEETDDELKTFDSDEDVYIGDDEIDNNEEIGDDEEFQTVDLGDETEESDEDDIFEEPVNTDEETPEIPEETPVSNAINVQSEDIAGNEDEAVPGEDATDIFGGDVENPLGDVGDDDVINLPDNAPKDAEEIYQPKYSYKIADVMFDENVKENKKEKSGSVIVIVPMIDGTGKKYVENKTIEFYLDDDNNPILDNDPMTNDLYAAIIDAIKSHADYAVVCDSAEPANEQVGGTIVPLMSDEDEDEDWVAAYLRDGNDEDRERHAEELGNEESEENDEWDFFKDTDDDEEEKVAFDAKPAESDEDDMFNFNLSDFDEEDKEKETEDVLIPTYKSGDTEIELPAPTADGTAIPESVNAVSKKVLKENKILNIKHEYKDKNGKRFFLNEATIKASKKMDENVTPLTEEIIDGSDTNEISTSELTGNEPIENYNEKNDYSLLYKLFDKAQVCAANANEDGNDINISDLIHLNGNLVYFFDIASGTDQSAYKVYQVDDMIYFRDAQEFDNIVSDLSDEVPLEIADALKYEYNNEQELVGYPITDESDCMFLISSIFSSLTGNSYDTENELTENVKIRRFTKIDSENDIDNSKAADEAKYGTKSENDFKQEKEDIQKRDGIIGALDPQQEENASYKPTLPNINLLTEQELNRILEGKEIEYEVNDKVLYKGELWDVFALTGIVGDKQLLKITKDGMVLDVTNKDIKPNPSLLKEIDPTLTAQFDFDNNNLTKTPTNPKAEKMADLNGKTVECNIVVDSTTLTGTLNGDRFRASLKDILEGLDDIRVYVGDNKLPEQTWHKNNIVIEEEDWIPAVIATEEDDPIRKIKVNPKSYVEALDDTDLVDCTVADKKTQLPKHSIRILV